jgi:excisionase family DNA binding protein
MNRRSSGAVPARAWLTIHEASDLIGVSPATLRRWTESGDLEAFVTPGGHRRFSRTAIQSLLSAAGGRAVRVRDLGRTTEHLVGQYRRELANPTPLADWMGDLSEEDREKFRVPGRRILAGVLGFLDAGSPEDAEALLSGAFEAAGLYGGMAREHGVEADVLTDTYLRFRLLFLNELSRIAKRRRLALNEAADLLLAASRVFDRLLIALIQGHRDLPIRDPATLAEALIPTRPARRRLSRAALETEPGQA